MKLLIILLLAISIYPQTGKSVLTQAQKDSIQGYISDSLTVKLGTNWVTPQMFGAKGDSLTDDSQALQDAINYASNNGKRIYIPSGDYIYNTTLTVLSDGINIVGSGIKATNLIYTGNSDGIKIGQDTTRLNGVEYFLMSGLSLIGKAGSQSGINCYNVSQITLDHIFVSHFGLDGLTFYNASWTNKMNDCTFYHNDSAGVAIRTPYYDEPMDLTVWNNCLFWENNIGFYDHPVNLATKEQTFIGCNFLTNTSYGMKLEQEISQFLLLNCGFESNGIRDIQALAFFNSKVLNCQFTSSIDYNVQITYFEYNSSFEGCSATAGTSAFMNVTSEMGRYGGAYLINNRTYPHQLYFNSEFYDAGSLMFVDTLDVQGVLKFNTLGTGVSGYIYGAELCQNSTFDSDAWWSKQTGITIADNVCHFTSVANYKSLYVDVFTVGHSYLVMLDISNYSAGGVYIASGGTNFQSNGTHYRVLTDVADTYLYIGTENNSSTTLDIDNVTIKEILNP